jgi:hypothetical protein
MVVAGCCGDGRVGWLPTARIWLSEIHGCHNKIFTVRILIVSRTAQ